MTKSRTVSLFITLQLTLLLSIAHIAHAGEYNAILNIGDPLPAFSKLPSTLNGPVSSADIQGQVLVLVSLANHCPWVQGMDYALIELAKKYEGQDVIFLGFSVSQREEDKLLAMKEYATKKRYPFNYMYDASQNLGRALGATKTPEYFVFNEERKLVYMGAIHNSPAKKSGWKIIHSNGKPSDFYVDDAIQATLNGQAAPTSETKAHGCTVEYVKTEREQLLHDMPHAAESDALDSKQEPLISAPAKSSNTNNKTEEADLNKAEPQKTNTKTLTVSDEKPIASSKLTPNEDTNTSINKEYSSRISAAKVNTEHSVGENNRHSNAPKLNTSTASQITNATATEAPAESN